MVGWMMWGAKGAPACVTFKICAFLQMTFQSHRTITNWYHMMEFMHRHQLTGDGRRQRTCRTSRSCRSVIGARCLVLGAWCSVLSWLLEWRLLVAAKLSGSFLPFIVAVVGRLPFRFLRFVVASGPPYAPVSIVLCPLSCVCCLLSEVGRSAVPRLRPDHSFVKLSGHGSAVGEISCRWHQECHLDFTAADVAISSWLYLQRHPYQISSQWLSFCGQKTTIYICSFELKS